MARVTILNFQSEQFSYLWSTSHPNSSSFEWISLYKSPPYFLSSFPSIGLSIQEKRFELDFQDGYCGGHLVFQIRTILATSDLQSPRYFLPTFKSNGILDQEMKSKIDFQVQYIFSRWQLWWPSSISNHNNFSCFWSTNCPNTSYQVSNHLAFPFKKRGSK